jgi:predicted transcriptional regulator
MNQTSTVRLPKEWQRKISDIARARGQKIHAYLLPILAKRVEADHKRLTKGKR